MSSATPTAWLARIDAVGRSSAAPVTFRLASHDDERLCHLDDGDPDRGVWWPAIARLPRLGYDFFDGAFGGEIVTPTGTAELSVEGVPGLAALMLPGARIRWWTGPLGGAWGDFTLRFDGLVTGQPAVRDGVAALAFRVDDAWLDDPLLATYAGTTGAEGEAALKGQVKPLLLGAPRMVGGVLLDSVANIIQLSDGPIAAVEAALENADRFTASIGDYPSYAALDAADIPAGRWATALAAGLVRHGAPGDGVLTYDVRGSNAGADGGGWARRAGAIVRRLAARAGRLDRVDNAALAALDAARPWNLSLALQSQVTMREVALSIAQSVNAVALVTWTGLLTLLPIDPPEGAPVTGTLDSGGAALPPVAPPVQLAIAAPWWRLAIEAEVTHRVHGPDEIRFSAPLVDRGRYLPEESYREGHIVDLADGSRWLYINPAPSIGNAPPAWPTPSNSWWSNLTPPLDAAGISYTDGTPIEDLKPAEPDATVGGTLGENVKDSTGNVLGDADVITGQGTANDVANIGGTPTAAVKATIAAALASIADLTGMYGDTATAAANAQQARDDAQAALALAEGAATTAGQGAADSVAAKAAAELARNTAQTKATEATGAASTAIAKAAEAVQSASDSDAARLAAELARGTAQTAATNSTAAKEAAELARTQAQTKAGEAAASASAAAGSASTASTKATEAASSASAAQASATTATTKAGEASTSASNAATSATNAQGSANTATSQASLSASSAARAAESAGTRGLTPNGDFDRPLAGAWSNGWDWTSVAMPEAQRAESWQGRSGVIGAGATASINVVAKQPVAIVPGRVYRLKSSVYSSSATARHYLGVGFLDADKAFTSANSGRVYAAGGVTAPVDVWTDAASWPFYLDAVTNQIKRADTGAVLLSNTETSKAIAWMHPLSLLNYLPATYGYGIALDYLYIDDVTAEHNSAASASAAATSASIASTKASEAGASATSATNAANTATTQAGLAAGSASAAATSATSANASKTAAESGATSANAAKVAAESARDAASGSATAAAGSASVATTKATEASNSASAAQSSATTAATKSGEAAASASASATSASNASASKTAAENAASAASTSASNASTAAGNAQTYAGQAASARDTAQGHAATATTQAGIAATSASTATGISRDALPSTFEQEGLYFVEANGGWVGSPETRPSVSGSGLYSFVTVAGVGKVAQTSSTGGSIDLAPKGVIAVRPGRIYRCSVTCRTLSGTRDHVAYVGGLDASYAYVPAATTGSGPIAVTTDWATLSRTVNGTDLIAAGAAYIRGFSRWAAGSAVGQTSQIKFEDVTESEAAKAQAAAAASSASTAATKATEAASSATSASNAANTATTRAGEAAGSAGAAATSASNAAGSATAAGNSATAAQGSATTANTKAGEAAASASTAATQASNATTAKTAAETAASNASTSATNAANSQSAAAGSASAAAGSASTANTRAGEATAAASAAQASATTANTKAGEASVSASSAASSASTAQGHANTATSQASLAASSATAAQTARNLIARADFGDGDGYWVADFALTKSQLAGRASPSIAWGDVTLEPVAGVGTVLQANGVYRVMSERATRPFVAGQKIRVRLKERLTSNQTTGVHAQSVWITRNNAAGAHAGYRTVTSYSGLTVAEGWVERDYTFEPDALRTGGVNDTGDATEWRLMVGLNGYSVSSPAGAVLQIASIGIDDVTAVVAANAAATAAATSASTASTKADQASSSATSASGSANTATTQAGLAAGSATAAANSATAASASKTAAENSASAANVAKVAAESARDAASGSASAASSSASTAATKASEAAASASSATTSANTATTKAGEASTSASNAATSATNAQGSANMATSQATLSASSAARAAESAGTRGLTPNGDFDRPLAGAWSNGWDWTAPAMPESQRAESWQGRSGVIGAGATASINVVATQPVAIVPGRVYRLKSSVYSSSATARHYLGVGFLDADKAFVSANSGRVYAAGGVTAPVDVWTDASSWPFYLDAVTNQIKRADTGAVLLSNTETSKAIAWMHPLSLLNYLPATYGYGIALDYLYIEDVTAEHNSAASASAAASSASTAATKATEASNSASAASTAATNAATSAGNASASAGTASTHASNALTSANGAATSASAAASSATTANTKAGEASASASAASTSAAAASAADSAAQMAATLSASFGGNALNANPVFSDWPNAGAAPAGWVLGAGTLTRDTGKLSPYAARLTSTAGQNGVHLYRDIGSTAARGVKAGDWLVLEGDAELVSGTTVGGGVCVGVYNSSGTLLQTLYAPFPAGSSVGSVYTVRKIVQVSHADAYYLRLWAAAHNSGLGAVAAANAMRFLSSKVRYATDAEIAANTVLPDLQSTVSTQGSVLSSQTTQLASLQTTVSAQGATVSSHTTALSTIDGKLYAGWGVTLNAHGVVTGRVRLDGTGAVSTFAVQADVIEFTNSEGVGSKPFEIVDGVTYIKAAAIKDLSVERAKIAYGVAGEASLYSNANALTFNSQSVWQTIASTTITPTEGAPLWGSFICILTDTSGANTQVLCRVVRDDGTVLWGGAAGLQVSARDEGETLSLVWLDNVDADRATTYTVQMKKKSGASDMVRVDGRVLFVEEMSRHHFQSISMAAAAGEGPGRGTAGGGKINGVIGLNLIDFY